MVGPFFEKDAPKRFEIAPKDEINDPELSAVILGRVLNKHCKPIKNAVVDLWYAGGKPGMMSSLTIPILTVKYNASEDILLSYEYLLADHRKNTLNFMGDVNLWTAG